MMSGVTRLSGSRRFSVLDGEAARCDASDQANHHRRSGRAQRTVGPAADKRERVAMRLVRRGTALWSIGALALAVYACETSRRIGGVVPDTQSPVITLTNAAGDTQDIAGGLRFNVQAVDNLGLKDISLTFSGGLIGVLDTVFHSQVKTYTVGHTLTFPSNSGAGGQIMIVGRATDGAGNFSSDTIFIFLSNVQALRVRLVLPSPGALASTGKGIPIDVIAVPNGGIAKI